LQDAEDAALEAASAGCQRWTGTETGAIVVISWRIMPKAKPVSLHPLSFHDAFKAIVNVDPEKVGITTKRRERLSKKKSKAAPNDCKSNKVGNR
jgi:hypothetical protein